MDVVINCAMVQGEQIYGDIWSSACIVSPPVRLREVGLVLHEVISGSWNKASGAVWWECDSVCQVPLQDSFRPLLPHCCHAVLCSDSHIGRAVLVSGEQMQVLGMVFIYCYCKIWWIFCRWRRFTNHHKMDLGDEQEKFHPSAQLHSKQLSIFNNLASQHWHWYFFTFSIHYLVQRSAVLVLH